MEGVERLPGAECRHQGHSTLLIFSTSVLNYTNCLSVSVLGAKENWDHPLLPSHYRMGLYSHCRALKERSSHCAAPTGGGLQQNCLQLPGLSSSGNTAGTLEVSECVAK